MTVATSLLAAVMVHLGNASWLEAASFVTGAVAVWLTVRENVWNFPIGMVNVATFSVVFAQAGLYGDAGLQGVYFVLLALGWYWWLHGGQQHTQLRITRTTRPELATLAASGVFLTLGLWAGLRYVGGSASFWDALTTGFSLVAQWMMSRKRLECWLGWIFVNVIYVPLYVSKGLYLTAVLYAVFLVMAVMGYRQWRQTWKAPTITQ